ncbi:uncharacterized protein LOC132278145 [Cornus florida]|uniref:uncharacterized protein LOC132278145 n=1 Tax=Cornus florida TaxID=4283 RepID=UPI00289F91A2|nr:uncharacterized protein LOC132278145 [Cornus florida]
MVILFTFGMIDGSLVYLSPIVTVILGCSFSIFSREDKLGWDGEPNSEVSVKSAYYLANQLGRQGEVRSQDASSFVPNQNFVYGIVVEVVCPRCGIEEESMEHMLFICPHSIQIWKLLPLRFDFMVEPPSSFTNWWMTLVRKSASKDEGQDVLGLVAYCCWGIWKARNKFVFDGQLSDPSRVVLLACSSFWEFKEASCSLTLTLTSYKYGPDSALFSHPSPSRWLPPIDGIVKCNVNASFSSFTQVGGGGAIFRDSREIILQAVIFSPLLACSAMAEPICFRKAVMWVLSSPYIQVWFECDSLLVVLAVNRVACGPVEIHSISFDVQVALMRFSFSRLSHVLRHGNGAVHAFAQLSHQHIQDDFAMVHILGDILDLAANDCLF